MGRWPSLRHPHDCLALQGIGPGQPVHVEERIHRSLGIYLNVDENVQGKASSTKLCPCSSLSPQRSRWRRRVVQRRLEVAGMVMIVVFIIYSTSPGTVSRVLG